MDMEDFLVDINEDASTIVINDKWGVTGALELSVSLNTDPTFDNLENEFIIRGILKTEFYERELQKIESRRYIIENIDVKKETYETLTDNILYEFTAGKMRVKYQISQVVDIEELLKEQKNDEQ